MKRKIFTFFLTIVSMFFSVSFAINYGGNVNIAIPTDVAETLDPHKATGALTFEILYNVYEGLVSVSTEGELIPSLAKSWEISDDGLEYEFLLKDNVFFHSGSKFSADDVKYSFERILNPETGYPKASNYSQIDEIAIPGPNTVIFRLKSPYKPFLALVSKIYIVPEHTEYDLDSQPDGTGPFILESWERDRYMKLIKNPVYHETGLPYIDSAYFRIIPDINSSILALKTGDIDVFPRMDPSFLDNIKSTNHLGFIKAPMNLVQVLAINNDNEILKNEKVRQAVNYAIDKEILIEFVALGLARPISVHLPKSSPYYIELGDKYSYDPDKAVELLKEAGYYGKMELTIALPQPYVFHQRTGEVIAQMLSEVGIKVNLQIYEWGKWISDVYKSRKYDMTIIGHEGEADPYLLLERFKSDSSRNYMNVRNPEIDRLLEEYVVQTDDEKGMDIIHEILGIMVENAVAAWTMEPEEIVGINKKIKNWKIYPVYVDALKEVWIE